MSEARILRGGIIGAGRSRNGLGPFLAQHFEAAGGEVVGVVGRDQDHAADAGAFLASRLGHPLASYGAIEGLLEQHLDALIVAAPVPVHLPSLRAVCGSGVAVLCEKPLGMPDESDAVAAVLARFLAQDQLLMENCQWPEALPAWRELFPGRGAEPIREVAMGLSPSAADGMLEDSLSHLISVVQDLVPVNSDSLISGLRVSEVPDESDGRAYEFLLEVGPGPVACRLELRPQERQPRPAWLAINGSRMDRQIAMESYEVSFHGGNSSISIGDPLAHLVYRFVRCVREPCSHERIRTESDSISQRARVYYRCLDGFGCG